MNKSKTLIIGIGNKLRGDDAAGLLALKKIRELAPEGVELLENNGDGAELINKWTGRENVILIDAVLSGSPPGTVHKFSAPGNMVPSEMFKFSTHLFSVPQAIYLSASLGNLPKKLTIYGIEAKSFDYGSQVCDEVESAINNIVEHVNQII